MSPLRHGVVILTDLPWSQAAPLWRAAEGLGFDHAWTYDHLVWGGLPDSEWRAAMPTLAAAATVTERIGLGTFVASPNFRHPYVLARDLATLDDLSGGRVLCGVGAGGDLDAQILGEDLTLRERVARFHEFLPLLDRLLREDHVEHEGVWYSTRDARTRPGPVKPRVPLLVAANGPRSLRLAAAVGDGWITYGGRGDTLAAWVEHLAVLVARFDEAVDAAGRGPLRRILSLDSSPQYSLASVGVYEEMVGHATELGFTDVVSHWPRPDGPYAGEESVLEAVAAAIT